MIFRFRYKMRMETGYQFLNTNFFNVSIRYKLYLMLFVLRKLWCVI